MTDSIEATLARAGLDAMPDRSGGEKDNLRNPDAAYVRAP